jgi:hypothetical protein
MNDPKPLASLGPSLLARKGSAKPAMRPQAPGFAPVGNKAAAQSLEDLGWNDMGEDDAAADHSALAESGQAAAPAIPLRKPDPVPAEVTRLVPTPAVPVHAEKPAVRASTGYNRRAAFTLRLDAKRHLKLRLASTVRNRSAQQLVTEALDRFLNDIPEIEALAKQVQRD